MNGIKEAITKLLRGPRISRLLERFGIDPKRYWLLTDLFAELSERGEMLDELGRNGVALETVVKLYFGLSALFAVPFALAQPAPTTYLTAFLAFTAFLLLSILLAETGNSLVNPTEGLVLAHQPVNGATYTAAKLSHLLRIVLYLVPGLNAAPAFAGLILKTSGWSYPVLHLAAAFTVGLVAALLCCAFFGWLVRFVPVRRLKAAGQFAGTVPFLAMMWMQQIRTLLAHLDIRTWLPAQPAVRWSVGVVIAAGVVAVVALGIRSLSADYLIRVSGMVHGGASAASSARRSRIGALVRRFFGGQAGVAGFAYVSRMMLRDWQFRRQVVPMLVPALAGLGSMFASGWPADPFSGRFAPIHLLPHILGVLLLFVCILLPYGNDYRGAWIFLLAPSRAFEGFARGIYASLWIEVVVIPHLILLPLVAWPWGMRHTVLFVAYSIVIASSYLALGLRLIREIPFSKQADATRTAFMLPAMIMGGAGVAIAVGLQYFLVFRSAAVVALTIVALGIAAYVMTRASMGALAASLRYHLGRVSAETGTLYTEVEV